MTVYNAGPFRLFEGTAGDPSLRNAWAPPTSAVTTLMQVGVTGVIAVDLTGVTTFTLSALPNTADQSRPYVQNYTGAPSGNCTVTLPNVQRVGWAINATTGGHNVILTSGGGTQATIPPNGLWTFYYSDGAGNCSTVGVNFSSVNSVGEILAPAGILLSNSTPIQSKDAGGTARTILFMDNANNVDLENGGAARTRILNQAGTQELLGTDNAGNAQILTSLSVPTITYPGTEGHAIAFGWNGSFLNAHVDATNLGGIVLNNGVTYTISITGASGGAPWSGISSKPYAFNQSTDVGASPTFANVAATSFGASNAFYVGSIGSGSYWAWGGGNPALAFAANNYIQYTGNINYNATSSHVFNGNTAFTNGVFAQGNIIGQGSPTWSLQTSGNVSAWAAPVSVLCTNFCEAPGFGTYSDGRAKTEIKEISPESGVEWILRGRPVTYIMDGSCNRRAGFIAQDDWLSGRGEAISAIKDEDPKFAESDGIAKPGWRMVRDYTHDNAYLTAALQWCVARIKELEDRPPCRCRS